MMGFGFGGFGFLFMLLFWILIIALAVWLVTRIFPQANGSTSPPSGGGSNNQLVSPEDILKRRYAQGEISRSEYEEMREHLRT